MGLPHFAIGLIVALGCIFLAALVIAVLILRKRQKNQVRETISPKTQETLRISDERSFRKSFHVRKSFHQLFWTSRNLLTISF